MAEPKVIQSMAPADPSEVIFETKNIYEAAALYAMGQNLIGVRKDSTPGCWFQFRDGTYPGCQKIAQYFWSKNLTVNARLYADAIRNVRDFVYFRK